MKSQTKLCVFVPLWSILATQAIQRLDAPGFAETVSQIAREGVLADLFDGVEKLRVLAG